MHGTFIMCSWYVKSCHCAAFFKVLIVMMFCIHVLAVDILAYTHFQVSNILFYSFSYFPNVIGLMGELCITNVVCDYSFCTQNRFNILKYGGASKAGTPKILYPTLRIFGILDSGLFLPNFCDSNSFRLFRE